MVKNNLLSKNAYDYIKNLLIENYYKPGEPINESELQKKLGLSRTPIREALQRLKQENLVEIYPRRGTFVAIAPLSRLKQLFKARELIEGEITRIVTPIVPEEKIKNIKKQFIEIKNKDNYTEKERLKEMELGRQLDDLLIDTFNNEIIKEYWKNLNVELQVTCAISTRLNGIKIFTKQHLDIINAILDRNPEKSKKLMVEHIRTAQSKYFETI